MLPMPFFDVKPQPDVTPSLPRWILCIVGALAIVAFVNIGAQVEQRDAAWFERSASAVADRLSEHLRGHLSLLRATSSFMLHSGAADAETIRDFLASADAQRHYPSVRMVGFLARHGAGAGGRRDSGKTEAVYSVDWAHSLRGSSVAIDPRSFETDELEEAMTRARDEAEPALLGRLRDGAAGGDLVTVLPVYGGIDDPGTVDGRRSAASGFLFVAFAADELVTTAIPARLLANLNMRLVERRPEGEARVFFERHEISPKRDPLYSSERSLEIFGRQLSLETSSTAFFEQSSDRDLAYLVLAGALLAALVLSVFARRTVQARASLSESGRQIRIITDSLPVLIAYAGSDLRFRFNNAAYGKWFGLSASELKGAPIREVFGADTFGAMRDKLDLVINGESASLETSIACKDGTVREVSMDLVPYRAAGQAAFGIVILASDITDRKRYERSLRDNEERFRLVADKAPMMIWMSGLEGELTWVNRPWLEFRGTTMAEELRSGWAKAVHSDDIERIRRAYSEAYANRSPFSAEFRFARHDGEHRWILAAGVPLFGEDGGIGGYIGSAVDITDKKIAEQRLERFNERLEREVEQRTRALQESQEQLRRSERLASVGTLASGIAHEINNPLNSIMLASQYALSKELPDVASRSFRTILSEARRCSAIIKGILQFSSCERGAKCEEDLNKIVQRALDIAQSCAKKPMIVSLSLADDLPPIVVNRAEIEQVVMNLLQNAVDASFDEAHIEIETARSLEGVTIRIHDSGRGIAETHIEQIFDPFFTTRLEHGGTGLGLSVSHGIVQDYGGSITVESEPGRGASFAVHLPAERPTDYSV